jgi:hypothetical protein
MLSPGGNTMNFSRGGHGDLTLTPVALLSERRPRALTLAQPRNANSGCGIIAAAGIAVYDLGEPGALTAGPTAPIAAAVGLTHPDP